MNLQQQSFNLEQTNYATQSLKDTQAQVREGEGREGGREEGERREKGSGKTNPHLSSFFVFPTPTLFPSSLLSLSLP